jgi:F-type H+-transporting ATPase subunit b
VFTQAFEALGLNLPSLIAQIVNFTIVLVLLRIVAYKPILAMMERRRERIQEGLEAAERARAEAAQSEVNIQSQLDQARREGQEIVAQAQTVASRIQEESRAQAQREADQLLERARTEIQRESDAAVAGLRSEFADLTVDAAGKVINQSLDRDAHQRLINEVLEESRFSEN